MDPEIKAIKTLGQRGADIRWAVELNKITKDQYKEFTGCDYLVDQN